VLDLISVELFIEINHFLFKKHQWEYEKSWNLLEVKEYTELLFYKFLIDGKHMCIIYSDSFELKEEIVSFFGDVDILLIIWTKDAVKIFENIEAKVVREKIVWFR